MKTSKAQIEANKRYRKRNVKQLSTAFYPNDLDIWEWLDEQPNKAGYIKQLIREDMNKKKGL